MTNDTNHSNDPEGVLNLDTDRRRFLQAAGVGAAGLAALGGYTAAQSDSDNHIELEAVTIELGGGRGRSEYAWEDGEEGVVRGPPEAVCDAVGGQHVWMGVSPGTIADVTNPTLELTEGETYTVEWTNTDGETHNFVIVDGEGDELVSSDDLSTEGESQTVEFEATAEMAEYYCGTHPSSQRGDVDVAADGPDAGNAVPTGVQFWTLRGLEDEGLSTADVIRLVGGADNNGGPGYDIVEPHRMNNSSADEIRTALDDTGLEAPAAHIGLGALEDNLDTLIEDWHETIGATTFVINFVAEDQMDTVEKAEDLVDRMNAVAENLPDDVTLGYHNHNQEFMELGDGRTPIEIFDANLNDDVVFEIDVGWVYYAGEDPAEVLETYSDRTELIHLKEMNRGEESEFYTLGEGPMDVVEIADVARNVAEIDYMIYENDEPPEETSELSTAMGVMSFVDGREGFECMDFANVGRPDYDGELEGVPMGEPADFDGIPTGIQLYTLRDLPDSTPQLIRRVGAIDDNGGPGYDTIEFAGLDGSVEDVQTALEETGVEAPAAHLGLSELQGDSLSDTLDTYYDSLGVTHLVEPSLNVPEDPTDQDVQNLADEFNSVSENLPDDAVVGFHNHAAVFQELDDGRTILEALDEYLNDDVIFEIDVGWVLTAGHDPVDVISQYSDRVELLHMKDMEGGDFEELGEGDVDWNEVADLAQNEADVEYLIYEHDAPSDPAGSTGTGAGVLHFLDGAPGLQECIGIGDVGGPDYDGDLSGAAPEDVNLLLFSATAGFRHGNIGYGLDRLQAQEDRLAELADVDSVNIDTIEDDASAFPSDASELEQYDTIVWFNTVDNVLSDQAQRDAFEEYIQNGGGYAGIHAASDTHHPGAGEWDFYQGLIGDAYFIDHPGGENQIQEAEVQVTDQVHPSTDHLPARWSVEDEWYNFATNPRGDVHVLATVDESTYDLGESEGPMGDDHPIVWAQEYQGGRAWYTGRGHTEAAFDEENFMEHVLGGILWSGGFLEGDATGTVWDTYEKSEITTDLGEGMKLDTTPDGRLFFTERISGEVSVYDPEADDISTALSLDVYSGEEDGLQGIKFDPNFEDTGWVYIYYSPAEADLDEDDDMPYNLLSRFTVDGDTIDPESETEILRVHTQRESCCHVGGDIDFGPDGEELYLSTGDDTNPFSQLFAPLDEREGSFADDYPNSQVAGRDYTYFDAQRTAANTNDLRGSILRIIPNEDGSYDVPDDNLFTDDEYDDDLVRDEIYVMGCRNPYTMKVDDETGLLYYGDYGPDSSVSGERPNPWVDPDTGLVRGPPGIVEFNVVEEAGFHGWPYFTGSNIPYLDYDFETQETGDPFDPENPVNTSVNNDGLEELPPAQGATIFYTYAGETAEQLYNNVPEYAQEYVPEENPWPEIPGGGAPMAGPLFRSEDDFGDVGLPEYYDGKWFIMEWNQGWLKYVSFDEDEEVLDIEPFLPTEDYIAPQDMVVGPDGQLYLLEFGSGFADPDNPGLYVIEQPGADGDPEPEPDPVSVPYGIDSGGEDHEQAVSLDGLELDKLPNDAVTQTGDHTATSLLEADQEFTIEGTDNELLYKTEHYGTGIGYDVEVPNGTYDVTLHFAEIWFGVEGRGPDGSGEGDRVFDVSIQGETVLSDYDIYDEVGALTATTETIEGVEVDDETLSISSTTHEDNTKFSAIEIREADDEPEGVSAPFGYDASGGEIDGTVTIDGLDYVAESEFVEASGDASASADDSTVEPGTTGDSISGTDYEALHQSEEYGGNLSYDVAIEDGTYDVTLYFTEVWFGDSDAGGGGTGSREFDVTVEGQEVFSPLDIYDEVGHDAALTETVEDVEVTDGTLTIGTTTVSHNSQIGGFAIHEADDGEDGLELTVSNTGGGVADEPAISMSPSDGDMFQDPDSDGDPSGADDLSADVYLGYDADNLYLTVEVTDDTHEAMSGANMWEADSLQWAVGSGDTFGPEYGISHAPDGTAMHQWYEGNATAGTDAITADTSRSGSTTTYEATIPWNALFAESQGPGDSFPFSVLVNESDGGQRDGVLEWALPAISDTKSVADLGTLTLADEGAPEADVQVTTDDEHGDILADGDGNVLYMWDNDEQGSGASSCTDDCADSWPPLTVEDSPVAGDDVEADLTTFERADGSTQVAANGWPLYYFANDEDPGDTNGQGAGGETWWVLDPAGEPIRDGGGIPSEAIDPDTTIEFEARSNNAWTGVAPSDIEETDNPTLTLAEGEEYTVEWTNVNGALHNFAVELTDGSRPIATETMDETDATQTVPSFTASADMERYLCEPHDTLGMNGDIEIV